MHERKVHIQANANEHIRRHGMNARLFSIEIPNRASFPGSLVRRASLLHNTRADKSFVVSGVFDMESFLC